MFFRRQVGRFVKTPIIKLWAHTASYLLFLLLIITYSFTERDVQLAQTTLGSLPEIKRYTLSILQIAHAHIQEYSIYM